MKHRFTRAGLGVLAVTLVAAIGLTACSNDNDDASADHNSQDVAFAQNMIPHHGQAVQMAKMVSTRASNERVKSLAAQIEGAQQPEIDTMNRWLTSWGEAAVDPNMSMSEHARHGASMPGMMDADDMTRMQNATDAAFDRMFLQMMIEHHKGAIKMAQTEQEKGKFAEAKTMASSIITSQQAEINEMQQLLTQVG